MQQLETIQHNLEISVTSKMNVMSGYVVCDTDIETQIMHANDKVCRFL